MITKTKKSAILQHRLRKENVSKVMVCNVPYEERWKKSTRNNSPYEASKDKKNSKPKMGKMIGPKPDSSF